MNKKILSSKEFEKAIKPLEQIIGRKLSIMEYKTIYYSLFDSPTTKDFKFIIQKYSKFYNNYNPSDIEVDLIIDIFMRYGLTCRDLDRAFKIRIQQVLAKARDFPTPAELITLVVPDASINIYNNDERKKSEDSKKTAEELRLKKIESNFTRTFHK